jgi:hypothetical protein
MVVQAFLDCQTVLRSRLPAERKGLVAKQGEVTELHKAAERDDVVAILAFAKRPEFINARTAGGKDRCILRPSTARSTQ